MSHIKALFHDTPPVLKGPYDAHYLFKVLSTAILMFIGFSLVIEPNFILVAFGILLLGYSLYLLKKFEFDVFDFKTFSWKLIIIPIIGYLTILLNDSILVRFVDTLENQSAVDAEIKNYSFIVTLFTVAILPAVFEELIFRVLLLKALFRKHLFIGLIFSSVLFALAHGLGSVVEFFLFFNSAVIFGLVYLYTKRIEAAILCHFINNFISLIG